MINQAEYLAFNKNWHMTEIQTLSGGDQVIYMGKTRDQAGDVNAYTWCIKKVTITNTTVGTTTKQTIVEQYANGTNDFSNKWASRTTLTYKYIV